MTLRKRAPKTATTQADKVRRGTEGERLITRSLSREKLWNHKFANAGFGTVFDKLVVQPGGGWGMEVKTRLQPTIPFNESSITKNERRGLDGFMEKVGRDRAIIIGIWKTDEFTRAFVIPWAEVRDAVLSGRRGSIRMTDWPELPRIGSGFDMSRFGGGGDDNHCQQ